MEYCLVDLLEIELLKDSSENSLLVILDQSLTFSQFNSFLIQQLFDVIEEADNLKAVKHESIGKKAVTFAGLVKLNANLLQCLEDCGIIVSYYLKEDVLG